MDLRTATARTAMPPRAPATCLLILLLLLAATTTASSSSAHSSSRSSVAAFAMAPLRRSISSSATTIRPSPTGRIHGERRARPTTTSLYYLNKDDPNSSSTDVRTDVKSYLTQRSIQSLLYLLTTINDGTTASWLENEFLQPDDDDGEPNSNKKSSIVDYHGTGAAYLVDKGGWREIFLSLIETPPVTKRISLGKKFTGGGGKPIQDSYLNKLSGGSSDEQDAKSDAREAKPAPPKSYNPFGGPIVAGSEKKKDANAPATKTGTGRRGGGMGFGGSYLDSIGSNGSSPASSNGRSSGGSARVQQDGREAFHRSLLEARLELDRAASLDELEARLQREARTRIDAKRNQAKRERLHRSLLARRFSGGDILVNDVVNDAVAAHDKTEKKKGETTNEKLTQEGGSGEFSHREEALRRSLLAARLLAQRKGARAIDEQRDIARALKARRDELMAEKRQGGDQQQEKKNGRDDSDDKIKSRKKQAAEEKGAGEGGIDRQRLAADREQSMSTNPHVQSDDDEYYMDLTIDPLSVAQRLLAVRDQLALEFVEDLTLIYQADVQWLAKQSEQQGQPPPPPEADDGASLAKKRQADRRGKPSIATTFASISYPKKDDNDKTENKKDTEEAAEAASTPPSPLYERAAVRMHHEKLSYSSKGHSSSPFRRSNFDLLYNLATQASVHRLLRRLMAPVDDDDDDDDDDLLSSSSEDDDSADDEESQPFFAKAVPADKNKVSLHRQASFEWLREFYVSRVSSYFDGHVPYGRADDFVEEWLRQVPVRVADTDNNRINEDAMPYSSPSTSGLDHVNPRKLMKEMMKMRCEIAMEWRKSMRADTENDHGFLRLVMMDKRVANQSSASNGGVDNDGSGSGGVDMEGFQ